MDKKKTKVSMTVTVEVDTATWELEYGQDPAIDVPVYVLNLLQDSAGISDTRGTAAVRPHARRKGA